MNSITSYLFSCSPIVPNSPLRESNRNDEDSLDSPIKVTRKRSIASKKRLDSSSEEENGTPSAQITKKGNRTVM